MPEAALRYCLDAGCTNKVRRAPRCPEHHRARRRRPSSTSRGYTRAYEKLRPIVLSEERRCHRCGGPATEVDHLVPLRLGGSNDRSNLRAVCRSCNNKRAAEMRTTR